MVRSRAPLRDALRIQCDNFKQLAVAFKFTLISLCCAPNNPGSFWRR